jgi:serine/threonine protein kinase
MISELDVSATIDAPAISRTPALAGTVGDYVLDRKLGAGGMGEVFAAHHVHTRQVVALKFLSGSRPRQLYRFKREFRSIADLTHPNLVKLYALTVPHEGRPFFTMELVEGRPFVDWVRHGTAVGELPDLERLEHALGQLITGVHALHLRDLVHRDLKPSNVLVDGSGRVVILDFGLISELSDGEPRITDTGQMVGTPGYMAPEQASGELVGPAADYWAIGAMLYECLCGQPIHEGSYRQILAAKQLSLDTGTALIDAPEHLRQLCARLLVRLPEHRPKWTDLHVWLNLRTPAVAGPEQFFFGRDAELDELTHVLSTVRETRTMSVVHLRGAAGCGKSTLAARFCASLSRTDVLWFRSRCRERETVAYKAVDAIVDALSSHLRKLDAATLAACAPDHADALCQLFPILAELWPSAESPLLEPAIVRGLAWAGLRELLTRLSEQRPLLLHIDDVQWSDDDSIELLEALVRPPSAPALLLLLGYGHGLADTATMTRLSTSDVFAGEHAKVIELGPLPDADARQLAGAVMRSQALARGLELDERRASSVALRSGGNPLLIRQLLLADPKSSDDGDPGLGQVLQHRLDSLVPGARQLLETIAGFGGPQPARLALQLCPQASPATLAELVGQDLIVESPTGSGHDRDEHLIETAHDQISELVLARLDGKARARLHREIAAQLLAEVDGTPAGAELYAIVDHLGAGVELDAITDEQRPMLAQLTYQAGQHALESTAWALSLHYFERARVLVEPWLDEARSGRGQYELCFAIMFGRARAKDMCESGDSGAAYEELLGWTLSAEHLGRTAMTYIQTLAEDARWQTCLELGLDVLHRLGVNLPRSPGWPRALLEFYRGRRAAAVLDRERLCGMPEARDEHARAVMNVLVAIVSPAMTTHPPLAFSLIGRHARLLIEHGYHEWCEHGLTMLALFDSTIGAPQRAASLCDGVFEMLERRPGRTTAWMPCWISAYGVVYPRVRPLRDLTVGVEQTHQLACEFGQPRFAEWIAYVGVWLAFDAGTPLAELLSLVQRLRARARTKEASEATKMVELAARFVRVLLEGGLRALVSTDDLVDISAPQRSWLLTRQLLVTQLLGDRDEAWRLLVDIRRDHEPHYMGVYLKAEYAMLSVIVICDHWSERSWRERRRYRRVLRRCRRTTRSHARECNENFGPMFALVEAELAALDGRFETALQHYERSHTLASEQHNHWLSGLASQRLARLAANHGHSIVERAARANAGAAFEAWGAPGLASRSTS